MLFVRRTAVRNLIIFATLLLAAASVIWAGGAQEVTPQQSDDGYKFITTDELEFKWMLEDESLKVEVTAPTTGWVAVGFDPSRAMKDADFIFGFVKDGELNISDHYGSGAFSHEADTELGGTDDIISASGKEADGSTTVKFTIPLNSGDEYDVDLNPEQEHIVLFAYGPDGADDFSSKHSFRTKVNLQF